MSPAFYVGAFAAGAFEADAFAVSAWAADFPNPGNPIGEKPSRLTIRTIFEAGYVQTRPKHTTGNKVYTVRWETLGTADKEALVSFFQEVGASTFLWTPPNSSEVLIVRFASDQMKATMTSPGVWDVSGDLDKT